MRCSAYSVRNPMKKSYYFIDKKIEAHFCGKSQFRGCARLRLFVKIAYVQNLVRSIAFIIFIMNQSIIRFWLIAITFFVETEDRLQHCMKEQQAEDVPRSCDTF